jgi:outer membrane receptor protein involved in Fe transport
LFVTAPQTGFGYFKNFGKTLRQGLELSFDTTVIKRVNLGVNYTFLDATFQSPETVNGSGNSSNNDAQNGQPGLEGTINIAPGNRMALTPRHMAKGFAEIQVTRKFNLNLNVTAFSQSYARGNENNQHQPDGVVYLGPGYSAGYAVMNLGGRYQLRKRIELFGQITNLADRKYVTAAQLGPMGFNPLNGNYLARPLPATNGDFPVRQSTFYAPGAPRTIWGGVRIAF